MAKKETQKIMSGLMIVVGVILIGMYAVLAMNRARPSSGMLVVGIVDLLVGAVLLRRARAASFESSRE
jgi:hypothetical protein